MGEFVDSRMESLIPEMKLMVRHNLFTEEEVKTLVKRRRDFEYQLNKHTKTKSDYMHFITFESNLYRDIKQRRELNNIRKDVDKIDLSVARHVDNLYKTALNRFPEDVRMWTSYIQFCTTVGFTDSISKAFSRMLQIHIDKPQLWDMAAKWEREKNNSLENALGYLVRGLVHHPTDVLLHTEAFNHILLQAHGKGSGDTSQAEIMYTSALRNIKDPDFLLGLLKISEKYDFTEKLQMKMVADLKQTFPKEEIVSHTLAQKAFRNKEHTSPGDRLQACVAVYKEAVENIPTEKMWSYYLDAMLELNHEKDIGIIDQRDAIKNAFEEGHKCGLMPVRYYLHWLQILSLEGDNEDKILKIMSEALSKNKKSLELWEGLLRYQIVRNDVTAVRQVFDQAIEALGEDSLPIWRLMIMFKISTPDSDEEVQRLYVESLKQPAKISNVMKPKYIEWLAVTKSMTWVRNAYQAIALLPPFCLELHQKMAKLESYQIEPDVTSWRKCHENATMLFGKNNQDVWLDFVKFEATHGDPLQVPGIYSRAKSNLNSILLDIFELEYSKIMNDLAA